MLAVKKNLIIAILLILIAVLILFAAIPQNDNTNAEIDSDIIGFYLENSVLVVDNITDWANLTKLPSSYYFTGKTLIFNCDIDISLYPFTTKFNGVLEGNGHTIYNSSTNLFSEIQSAGIVRNLNFYNTESNKAVLALTNNGTIENITMAGSVSGSSAGAIVNLNNGLISNCFSYVSIIDTSTGEITSYLGGIANRNYGTISSSHYAGKMSLTNNTVTGGIVSINYGTLENCSSNAEIIVGTTKTTDNMLVGGLAGSSGFYSAYLSTISNCYFSGEVSYVEASLDFGARKNLAVAGLVGRSIYTDMDYCYSDITGSGNIYGILKATVAQPVYTNEVISGYEFYGTNLIANCYSAANLLQPVIYWTYDGGTDYEILAANNTTITQSVLLNNDETGLTDLLIAGGGSWTGEEGQATTLANSFFSGNGTSSSPFIIENNNDVFELLAYLSDYSLSYYFEQTAELDFYGIDFIPLGLGRSFSAFYDGNDFAMHNLNATALFENNTGEISNLGFIGGNEGLLVAGYSSGIISNCYTKTSRYGTTYSNTYIFRNNSFVAAEVFGYTTDTFTNITPDIIFSAGDGTEVNPYVITTRRQLAAIGGFSASDHFILGADIAVNNSSETEKYHLNISGFSGTLDGKNHFIIGLIGEPLINGTITGTIKNLKIRGISVNTANTALLAANISNIGLAENITVFGSLSGNSCGGIANENNGNISNSINYAMLSGVGSAGITAINKLNITKSQNYDACEIGIASNSETGIIDQCINYAGVSFYNGIGTVTKSINELPAITELWDNNAVIYQNENITSDTLRLYPRYSFDVWGYELGNSDNPVMKFGGRFYKKDSGLDYFDTALTYDRIYSSSKSTLINNVEYALVKNNTVRSQITFIWYYNGISFSKADSPYIINAGYYKADAYYSGDGNNLPYTYEFEINISKADLPSPDMWGTGGIEGVASPYLYDGEEYDIHHITAFNLDGIVTEADYSYVITINNETVTLIKDAGIYGVNYTIDNINYKLYYGFVTVVIEKADLAITLENKTADYLSVLPPLTYLTSVETKAGATEEEKSTASLNAVNEILTSGGTPLCTYVAGDAIGDYTISFEVIMANYNVTIVQGKLSVLPIPLTNENIVFNGATLTYNGMVQRLEAVISDEDISAIYSNNSNINVGDYVITGVFSKLNYTALELEANLSIVKSSLNIQAEDMTVVYGDEPPIYRLASALFLGSDTISSLAGTAVFECLYTNSANIGEYTISVSGLSSENYQISFVEGMLTVGKAFMTNIFSYGNVSFTYNKAAKTNPIDLLGYEVTAVYKYYRGLFLLEQPPVTCGEYISSVTVGAINNNYRDTVFSSAIIINKANIEIYFEAAYSIIYDGYSHNLDHEGAMPENTVWGSTIQTGRMGGQDYTSFTNVGNYNITMSFLENDNYNDKTITTVLTIIPMNITIAINGNKTYNRAVQYPVYNIIEEINPSDTVGISWQYSLSGYDYKVSTVTNAGTYIAYPASVNTNYIITNNPEFRIDKLLIIYTPSYIEFVYGDYKELVYEGRRFITAATTVIEKNFYIELKNDTVDVEYIYSGPAYGIYNVNSVRDTSNYNFELAAGSATNKIRVMKRELTQTWNDTVIILEYNGAMQQPFTVDFGNVVYGESVETVIRANGNLKTAGSYMLWVELIDSTNYSLAAMNVTLEITKAALTVKANDISVEKGKTSVSYTSTITGIKGTDTLSLLGHYLEYNCAYTDTTPVGVSLPVAITQFTDNNYDITFVAGTLTVRDRDYPLMTISDKISTYDGKMKSVTLNTALPAGATVSYINNYKNDAGIYNVTAYVRFPNNTTQTLYAILTITKATPELFMQDITIPYSVVAILENNDIIGIAKLNDNEVDGTFSWNGETTLRKGVNAYNVIFTPTDSNNFFSITAAVNVEGKAVKEEALTFDNETVVVIDKNMYISKTTTITLSDEYTGTVLYLNGAVVEQITISSSGQYQIDIKLDGNTVYSKNFTVELVKDDDPLPVPKGEEIFDITGGEISKEGILVLELCYIKIKSEYSDMSLFRDGEPANTVILTGTEKTVKIQVKQAGILVYSRVFAVNLPETVAEGETEITDNWLWLKVVGGIVGGLAFIYVAFLLIKHIINKKKKIYNPYEAVEKKKRHR